MGGKHFKNDDAFIRTAVRDVKRLERLAGLTAESRLLDWGCGAGRLAVGVREHFPDRRIADYHGVLIEPSDANGLKFRVQSSDVLVAQMEAIGGSPQKMAFSEVYGALQQGVVDGQENTWSHIYGKKFFEVQDGVTETNHGALDYLVMTSVDWLDSLEPEVRDQFLTILGEVTATRNAESTKVNGEARQAIIDAGGVVRELTPEQRAAWVDAMKPVWDKFAGDVGQDMIDAAQAINAGM